MSRIAFFTPLPPVQSGIAQYSAELLPLLGQALSIDVYVDGYQPAIDLAGTARILPARHFARQQRAQPYAAIVYQMGNSPAHAYMWPFVTRYPGLLVLHDYVLHHLQVWLAVNRRGARGYLAEMERRYGATGLAVARQTLRGQMPAAIFDYPLCEGLVEASPLVAVHSADAAALVGRRCAGATLERLPMGMPLYTLPTPATARARLGLPATAPIIASLGHLNPHKRIDVALRAFRRVRERHPTALLVIAGSESPEVNLQRQVRMLRLETAVHRLGYLAEASIPDLLAAADVVVNLRYPTAGETSASLLRILAAGKPVVVSRAGSMAEVPVGVVAQVAPDAVEEELLAELLSRLLGDEPLRHQMAHQARAFIEQQHTLPLAAAAYLRVLSRLLGHPLPVPDFAPVVIDARAGGPRQAPVVAAAPPPAADPLLEAVATAITDLALDGVTPVLQATASALTALNLTAHRPAG